MQNGLDAANKRVAELEARVAEAQREANSLAISLWKQYYQDVAPNFELLDTPAGVISQIDNMTAGVCSQIDEARKIIRETLGMGFYYCDEDSGVTHRDLCRRVDRFLHLTREDKSDE